MKIAPDLESYTLFLVLVVPGLITMHVESTKNCGAHLMLQVRTRTLDGTLRRSSSSGIRLKAGARSVEVEP